MEGGGQSGVWPAPAGKGVARKGFPGLEVSPERGVSMGRGGSKQTWRRLNCRGKGTQRSLGSAGGPHFRVEGSELREVEKLVPGHTARQAQKQG